MEIYVSTVLENQRIHSTLKLVLVIGHVIMDILEMEIVVS